MGTRKSKGPRKLSNLTKKESLKYRGARKSKLNGAPNCRVPGVKNKGEEIHEARKYKGIR